MKIDEQGIREACETSNSMAEAASKLGMNYQTFRKHAKMLGYWKPNPSGKGGSRKKAEGKDKFVLADILNGLHPQYSGHKLRLRLIAEGIKSDKCEECGVEDWLGEPLTKHLDHIDGNHYNHRLENLRVLCPNCHQQTEPHGSKKFKMGR